MHTTLRFTMFAIAAMAVGCTTVPLDEEVLFQGKETVVPGDFPAFGYELEATTLDAGGAQLDGRVLDRPNETATVLYFGGQGFHLVHSRPTIELFAAQNLDVVMFDYRGYGKSTGEPTVTKLKEDALAISQFVKDRGIDRDRLLVHGHSMGSFLATWVAEQHGAAALVLEAPATDAEHWKETVLPWWLRMFIDFEVPVDLAAESNLERVERLEQPLLVVVGTEDPITPPVLARAVHERSASGSKKLVEVEGADHNNLPETEQFARAYKAFIAEQWQATAASSPPK